MCSAHVRSLPGEDATKNQMKEQQTKQKRKTLQRSRYEKGPYVSDYCDGSHRKPHDEWMSLVASTGTTGFVATTAHSGSRQIEGGVL